MQEQNLHNERGGGRQNSAFCRSSGRNTAFQRQGRRPMQGRGLRLPEPAAGHISDTCLVVSEKACGIRYAGRMNGNEFHVIYAHVGLCTKAYDTQLYRSVGARLQPGMQLWRERFYVNGGECSLNALPFSGVKSFIRMLLADPLSGGRPEALKLAQQAFAGPMPEGRIYLIPPEWPYSLAALPIPQTKTQALPVGDFLVPAVYERSDLWVPMGLFCRWFNLSLKDAVGFLDEYRGKYAERYLRAPGLQAPGELCVPIWQMYRYLLDMAARRRARGKRNWQDLLFYGRLFQAFIDNDLEEVDALCRSRHVLRELAGARAGGFVSRSPQDASRLDAADEERGVQAGGEAAGQGRTGF